MADVFDEIHQQPPAAGGDVFDQIHGGTGNDTGTVEGMLKSYWNQVNPVTRVAAMAHPILHPVDTVENIAKNTADSFKSAKDSFDKGDYGAAVRHAFSYLTGGVPTMEPVAFSQAVKKAASGDVNGAITDTAAEATNVLENLALQKAGDKAGGAIARGAARAADATSSGLMRGALRGGFTVNSPAEEVASAVDTAKAQDIPVSNAGVSKIKIALEALRGQTNDAVDTAANAGAAVNPTSVEMKLQELRTRYAAQVNNAEDLKSIDKVLANFRNEVYQTKPATPGTPASKILDPETGQPVTPAIPGTPATQVPKPIPVDKAQAMKVGTYEANAKAYGSDAAVPPQLRATVAAEKALAEGLREELERQIPELGSLNAKQAQLLNLQGVLEKAVNKYNNKGVFGRLAGDLGLGGGAFAGGLAIHDPVAATGAAAMKIIMSDPVVESRLAIAINKAQQANPGKYGAPALTTALSRLRTYRDSLVPPAAPGYTPPGPIEIAK